MTYESIYFLLITEVLEAALAALVALEFSLLVAAIAEAIASKIELFLKS